MLLCGPPVVSLTTSFITFSIMILVKHYTILEDEENNSRQYMWCSESWYSLHVYECVVPGASVDLDQHHRPDNQKTPTCTVQFTLWLLLFACVRSENVSRFQEKCSYKCSYCEVSWQWNEPLNLEPQIRVLFVKWSPCHHHGTIRTDKRFIGVTLTWQKLNLAQPLLLTPRQPLLQGLTSWDALKCPSACHHYTDLFVLVVQLFVWLTLIWPLSRQQAFVNPTSLQLYGWVHAFFFSTQSTVEQKTKKRRSAVSERHLA